MWLDYADRKHMRVSGDMTEAVAVLVEIWAGDCWVRKQPQIALVKPIVRRLVPRDCKVDSLHCDVEKRRGKNGPAVQQPNGAASPLHWTTFAGWPLVAVQLEGRGD